MISLCVWGGGGMEFSGGMQAPIFVEDVEYVLALISLFFIVIMEIAGVSQRH